MDLFTHAAASAAPLAERMRPRTLAEFVGQEHLTAPGRFLRRAIEADQVPSLILWGPPGTGKTTLAQVVAQSTGAHFHPLSAVLAGVKDLREVVAAAADRLRMNNKRTLLFVDEIHRFNKAQQDALLPHVEKGTVTLIGATTENPSFEVNAALLSRCRVVTLRGLEDEEVQEVMRRALSDPRGLAGKVTAEADALEAIARAAGGDARKALTALEVAANQGGGRVDKAAAQEALQHKAILYDKGAEEHYNVVSAFIKSLRGSDPDAALYWMARMLEGGEDPLFILRRMVIFASEDIGNADVRALGVACDALRAVQLVGLPEGVIPMAQAVTFLALAPKSNASYAAINAAREAVQQSGALPVPLKLRNAPTKLMKQIGYGAGYQYPHNYDGHYVAEQYLPDALQGRRFYQPSRQGDEAALADRLEELRAKAGARERGEKP